MQFEYDPEQLIEEVKKRPGIWDSEHADYRAKIVKAKMWHEVVKELVSLNHANMSKSEMRELELQLQKKWKSLRDCFQKYVVNPTKFKRPYIHSKQLQFLLKDKKMPAVKKKTPIQIGSSESDEEDLKPKNVWVSKKKIKLQTLDLDSDNNDNTEDYTFEVSAIAEPTHNIPSEGHSQFAFANVDTQLKPDTEDADRMFLMSLLPHLRTIPEEFRLNVKLELMQILRVANESTAKFKYPSSRID